MYDLIVVGAGPVGSYLAGEFARRDKNVLLLERGEVGKPLQCSGHISRELFDFIPKNEDLIENKIRGARFHSGGTTYAVNKEKTVSYVIDRTKMDRFLLERAKKRGVEFRRENFEDVAELPDRVGIKTNKEHYEAKMLAGCDGPLSTVRNKLHLPEPKRMLHGVFTYEEGERDDKVDVFLDRTDDFFAWKIPRKEKVEYGLATAPKNNAKQKLKRFSEEEGFEIGDFYSGLIPLLPRKRTSSERCFLCGDAAAQVKPFTGGGVIYGLNAAREAVRVVDPDDAGTIEQYENKWRKKLSKDIWIGERIRKIYSSSDLTKKIFLSGLVKFQDRIQMDRPSSFFS
ncbi:MAG: geranylgeranyl reductase family protein [Candidatus Aenigmatarchaeota archaeon]